MAGLNLGLSANAQVRSPGPQAPPPALTAGTAGFGPAYSAASPSGRHALFPNDPFGIMFWTGAAALGILVFIRYSLPA